MATIEEWSCLPESSLALGAVAANAGSLFALAVQTLLAAQCALVNPNNNPPDRTDEILEGKTEFDFIVVGAGSAGSVVANRLTEVENWNVLLIEAGGDPQLTNEMPITFFQNLNTPLDWKYTTEPNYKTCLGNIDQRCRWPRGKVMGGSSAINGMFYIRGNKEDYNEWESEGNKGWSYEHVLEYFKKSENFNGSEDYYNKHKEYHGKGGYLNIEKYNINDSLSNIIIAGQKELGTRHIYEHNGPQQIGISKGLATITDGRRLSSAKAFLNSVKERNNLYTIKKSLVEKININNKNQATGVTVTLNNGKQYILNAKKEVVIASGTINTPQLLLLSGIGPKDHLMEKGIDVVQNLNVGENLQDHITTPVFFEVKRGTLKELSKSDKGNEYAQYLTKSKSIFGTLLSGEVVQFIDTTGNDVVPDIQCHYIPLYPNDTLLFEAYYKGMGFTDEAFEAVAKLNKESCLLMVYTILLRPYSKGKIILKSKNAHEHPLIFPNYFENEKDLEVIMKGMELLEHLTDTEVFKNENIKLIKLDYEPCSKFQLRTKEYRRCITQYYGFTLYHPVGTAKMGPRSDPTSVVDYTLKVHGIKGLRVADGSVIPTIVRGNTNAPIIMIGEKASDFIKDEWEKLKDEL